MIKFLFKPLMQLLQVFEHGLLRLVQNENENIFFVYFFLTAAPWTYYHFPFFPT